MLKLACCAALGVLTLAACGKKPETPAPDVAPGEVAAPAAGTDTLAEPALAGAPAEVSGLPHHIQVETDYFVGEASFDEALFTAIPSVAAELVRDTQARMDAMAADALAYKQADPDYFRAYNLNVEWRVIAQAGSLISIEGFTGAYTGGAHGNYGTDARIYDIPTERELFLRDLLANPLDAVTASLPGILADITDKRMAAVGGGTSRETFRGETADIVSAESILDGEIGLAPSTLPGRIGGYVIHFAPYEIGSYAEGAYRIVVPQAGFHDALKPEYADLFAGEPVTEE